jgi:hypothetical protein
MRMHHITRLERNYRNFKFSEEQAVRIQRLADGVKDSDCTRIVDFIVDNLRMPPLPKDFFDAIRILNIQKNFEGRNEHGIKECIRCDQGWITAISKTPRYYGTKKGSFLSFVFKCSNGCRGDNNHDVATWSREAMDEYIFVPKNKSKYEIEEQLMKQLEEKL